MRTTWADFHGQRKASYSHVGFRQCEVCVRRLSEAALLWQKNMYYSRSQGVLTRSNHELLLRVEDKRSSGDTERNWNVDRFPVHGCQRYSGVSIGNLSPISDGTL